MPKPVTTEALVPWDEQLAQYAQTAQEGVKGIAGGGNFISTRGGRLAYQGGEIPGNKMNVIVVDYILENGWYAEAFDADNLASPDCYAFGRSLAEMRPHESSPQPQGGPEGGCLGCPLNEFGTADVGKGKACGNRVRLSLITEGDMENLETAEFAYLKLPPTSLKAWAGYVNQLAGVLHRPPFSVITEISIEPDPKTQFKVLFNMVEALEGDDVLKAMVDKKAQAEQEIEFPYPEKVAAPPAPVAAPTPKAPKPPRVAAVVGAPRVSAAPPPRAPVVPRVPAAVVGAPRVGVSAKPPKF